jgi:hypothetical protein
MGLENKGERVKEVMAKVKKAIKEALKSVFILTLRRQFQRGELLHIAIELPRTEIKVKGQIQVFPSKQIYVTNIENWGLGFVGITFADGDSVTTRRVPSALRVKILDDDTQRKLADKHARLDIDKLTRLLHHSFTIGSDPEIFVQDEKGIVIPAFNFLGSKASAETRTYQVEYGDKPLYWDGFQAEFETSAQSCLGFHTDSVYAGLKGLYEELKKHHKKGVISSRVVMDIPADMLRKAANEHVQFGCMPSKNAYGLEGHHKDGRDVPFRPAGGHIHFGVGKRPEKDYIRMVKALDGTIGVACVSLFEKFDDPRRRQLYGLPGEYRTPPHGMEYRTLSNAWLFHPMIMNLVFDVARKALVLGDKGLFEKHWQTPEKETIDCILNSDVAKAREILKTNEKVFKQLLTAAYGERPIETEILFNVFMSGMHKVLEDPSDIVKNWNLVGSKWQFHMDDNPKCVSTSMDKLTANKLIS